MQEIYIAAGCFWGVEAYYQKIKGIMSTEVGYANGPTNNVTYKEVCNSSGHVEVVKITFDENILSLKNLFTSYIRIINPFSLNKQGGDVGIQYRIGLYSKDLSLVEDMKTILSNWEKENSKSYIEILPLKSYTAAEKEHHNYLKNNPFGYCHINLTNIPKELLK